MTGKTPAEIFAEEDEAGHTPMEGKMTTKPVTKWELEGRLEKLDQAATKDAKLNLTLPKISPEEHGQLSRAVAAGARVRVTIAEIEPPLLQQGA